MNKTYTTVLFMSRHLSYPLVCVTGIHKRQGKNDIGNPEESVNFCLLTNEIVRQRIDGSNCLVKEWI